jgi:hypothetical protein
VFDGAGDGADVHDTVRTDEVFVLDRGIHVWSLE